MITSAVEDYIPNQDETEDGEISILFWSFAFVFLLIVTVWFYITQIAPIRRSAGRQIIDKEIDREEEVAKKILEQLTDDLRFKSDISKEDSLYNAASAPSGKKEDISVYEYIDDEIHIHYSKYGWDDESVESSDGSSSGLAAARRPSMENMDLIFPGFLPSIVEEEEIEEDSDSESSEKSQDTDVDDKFNADLSHLPTAHKQLVNNNDGMLESSGNIEYRLDLSKSGTKFVPFIESRETMTKDLQPKEDRVVVREPAESHSFYAFENVNHSATVKSIAEPVNVEQNGTSLLSSEIDNRCQVLDTENSKSISSPEPASHIYTLQSVIPTKCRAVAEVTSGSLDISAPKNEKETILDSVSDVSDSAIESSSLFTISSCDLAPALKQNANEIEEPNLHASNQQKISCPPNGLDHYFTRDIRFENLKNEENARGNIGNERDSKLSDASTEEVISGLTGIKMDVNKGDLAGFQLNGFIDEIAGTNDHTRHAWTFFSMSGSDETTKSEKGTSSTKEQLDQVEVPKIIIDSYDDGSKGDIIISNDDAGMDGPTRYANSFESDSFETDIDIDDVDLIDSDELHDEGEFSIYFKRHISVTDLDKILSEEGQVEANGDSSKDVLETDLSADPVEQRDVDVSSTRTVISSDEETNYSITAPETTHVDDGSDINIQKSIIVTSKLSDCLDKQPSEELQEFDTSIKSYEVETLMDDVSFQKDGVYGELVLSKLNDHQRDPSDDVSFDYYGEDWSEFIEDYGRERKPRLYTIPEDEEISSQEEGKGGQFESNLWGQARYNYSNCNELSVSKDSRLHAPIATMDASDSEFDLDDHSSSEAEKSGPEIDEHSEKKYQQKLLEEPSYSDKIITCNGFTKNGGINEAKNLANEKEKKFKEPFFSDKIISCNGVTETPEIGGVIDVVSDEQERSKEPELSNKIAAYNGVNGEHGIVGDSTRSVKIVKKIKIFVRKEVTITKDEQELQSPKQLIEEFGDHKQDKIDTVNESTETSARKEVEEAEIVPKFREQKMHSPHDVIKAEIGWDINFTQPLNFDDEHCNISEVIAKETEIIPKKESYTPPRPEQKVVDEVIEASVKNTPMRDATQFVTQALAQSNDLKVDAKPESKIVTDTVKVLPLSLEGDTPKSDGVEDSFNPLTKNDNREVITRAENVESCTSPTQKEVPARGITQMSPKRTKQKHLSKMVARFESKIEAETVKARRSSLESKVPNRDVTQDAEKLPVLSGQTKMDAKPKSEMKPGNDKASVSSVEASVPKRAVTQDAQKLDVQSFQTKVDDKPGSEMKPENVNTNASSIKASVPKREVTQEAQKLHVQGIQTKVDDKPESKMKPENDKTSASSVEASFSKQDVTQDAQKLPVQSVQTEVDDKPGSKTKPDNDKTSVSSVEASVSKGDVTQDIEKLPVAGSQTEINAKPESKSTSEAIHVKTTLVKEQVPKNGITKNVEKLGQMNRDAKLESQSTSQTIQMRTSFVKEEVTTRDVTQNLETIPVESDQTAIVAKHELKSTPGTIEARSVEQDVSKRDVTQQLENIPVQGDQMTIHAKPELESSPEPSLKADDPELVFTEHIESLPPESDITSVDVEPELKSTPETIQTRTVSVKQDVKKPDVQEYVERIPAQSDHPQIDAKPASKPTPATIKTTASTVKEDVIKRDVKEYVESVPSQSDQTQIDAKPASKPTPATIRTTASSVKEDVIKRDVTECVENSPTKSDLTQIVATPDTKSMPVTIKMTASSVKEDVVKRDVTEHVERIPAKSDRTQIVTKPDTKSTPATIKATATSLEAVASKRSITKDIAQTPGQNDDIVLENKPEPTITPEIKPRTSSVETISSKREIVKDLVKEPAQNDQTKSDRTDKVAKTVTKDDLKAKPKRSNVGLKLFISGKRSKEDSKAASENGMLSPSSSEEIAFAEETEVQSPESPPVTISVQGYDPQEDREGRKVRSPTRMSPTSWEKKPRKTYLASRNIRLSRSHEDLRFVERAPGEMQDSIQEEDTATHDAKSPCSGYSLSLNVPEDYEKEMIEPDSIHTAKITVQEVVGDKKRILILNVKKKVHGKARWKSLNDLDSIKMAVTPPRRSSELGNALVSFAEEEEKVEGRKGPTVLPVVEIKTRRKSLPEIEESRSEEQMVSPRRSPILKVTALQDHESMTEKDAPTRIIKARVMPVLVGGETPSDENVTEIRDKESSRREFKARVTQISSRESKPRVEREDVEGREENRSQERVISSPIASPVVETMSWLERETVTKISDSAAKGNTIKVRVARVTPAEEVPPQVEDKFSRPRLSPTVEALPKLRDEREIEARVSSIREVRYRQGRESGYGSLEMKDNDSGIPSAFNTLGSVRSDPASILGGVHERSVSSLSSIEDEFDREILGESRIMVTDLDALLAQQTTADTDEKPRPQSPETHEVMEKVHVWARMEPVPQKAVRINSNEQDDDKNLVIHHVKSEEPIVIEPVIVTEAASNEESKVISAFLVNDGYDDDELDEVFLEDYPPCGYPNSQGNSARKHSSDADSETSSVSSLPLKPRHRQTRAALEAANTGARNRTESSGSSKTATPVAELENEKAATSSGSSTPEIRASDISREGSFSYKRSERSPPATKETLTKFSSAFISLSRSTDFRRPRARSEETSTHKSDEEPSKQSKGLGSSLQKRGLGTSVQDVQTMPGLHIDQQRFKEAADSRKSMPDLTKRKQPINDSPFLRGLSAHTRKWLSQNAWMDSNEQQDEDLMTSDLFLYPSSRFQPGSNIDASFMSLAGERDFPDDISVSSLSTRPQSPMSEFSFAGEVPYWGMRRGSTTTVKCSNPRCEKEEVLFSGEKTTYTSCPACFTYYCTRNCRRIHWSEHKKVCFFGRINSYIRSFIYLCHKKEALKFQLSKAAKEGFKKKGRGCVLVTFASAQSARKFMTTGCTFFPSPPTYSSLQDLQAEGVVSKHRVALTQNIRDYDPEEEFVLNLAIIAGKMENLPANPVPRRKVTTVLQVIKIPLSSMLKEDASSSPSDPKTETKLFYLPKCARHEFVNENEARRHYCRNISKNLKQYGIRLKNDYPDVYEKLCLYVEQNIRFKEPLIVYGNQGKKIVMCKIMPEAGDDGKN